MKNTLNEIEGILDITERIVSVFEDSNRNYPKWGMERKKNNLESKKCISQLWDNFKWRNIYVIEILEGVMGTETNI